MRNPLGPLAYVERRNLILRAVAATAVTGLVQLATGAPLRGEVAPAGIVSLELAGSAARASEILASWRAEGVLGWASANVLLDYSFLAAYAALGVALAVTVAEGGGRPMVSLSLVAAWGMWAAGASDSLENIGLLIMIGGRVSDFVASATRLFAVVKFGLIAVGVTWVVIGWAWSVLRQRKT